ncbi:isopentenyl-diphosphate delta-isomerase [Gracilibacillus boraciitolerans JCM 21714]|uniref:Isopentenyl-diphosphate delta-isomerase n=1 Tax=Gracilibacillus boraciitolerans JCM 21714 TaxID=1298598 RepID=W4VFC6_9BACI|nr:ABC-ATPase domain-containing protein [Gracilibacillus boraciitolerans]GAE91902.1 isopentenyl-diphosphate delta-isomerase [Gracilibacillus boraciitolerans JCM 21714]
MKHLQHLLRNIDGKGYKGYKSLQGSYSFDQYEIAIDYVQGDPFAAPSKIRIIIPNENREIKEEWKQSKERSVYTADLLARSIAEAIQKESNASKGSGKSGLIYVDKPGQEILERTAVQLKQDQMIICLSIGLPANGRKINGKEAEKLFFTILPSILKNSVFAISDEDIEKRVHLADQHLAIRQKMKDNNWIAFIADGAILPRASGISDKPLTKAVPFESSEENRVEIAVPPHQVQPLTGMAIKKGISLIVGGGYHGKSTLLQALERGGVYHHITGDGREYVLTDPNAVKIRAEDGRQVTAVNISAFINDLPQQQDTQRFTTENASGSTSQATNVVEAIEASASTLLIDEDTSATNFMIRDARMQALVHPDKEPITPFIDKIKQLRDQLAVSTILVMGGSGDYFDVADEVIMMDQYKPYNVTEKVQEIIQQQPVSRQGTDNPFVEDMNQRIFLPNSLNVHKGKKKKVQAKSLDTIFMGRTTIQLQGVEQLIDPSQTRTIAEILRYMEAKSVLKEGKPLTELLNDIDKLIDQAGLQAFSPFPNQHPGGDLARPRRFEIAACLNRMRTAKIK